MGKMKNAKAAGAQSVLLYDKKVKARKNEREDVGGGLAQRRSLGASPNTGGVATLDIEKGVTIMGVEKGQEKPGINALMINRENGTALADAPKDGGTAKILGTDRFEFPDGIDE